MARTTEQEREHKRRQRAQPKAEQRIVTVTVTRGLLECLVLHDWLHPHEIGNAAATKKAV
jgi:hypothetical protein